MFSCLIEYNIVIKSKKCFIGYPLAIVLGRRVNSFGLLIIEEKLAAIKNLLFL
jgi:hypothetical protein